ncbi:NUP98_2 [Blepharisma stoltei]|uniref:Peptidase S59 domain-containing protein n=1 Tax=Blepharisma stoltei TaxID=1481888 RepID=A0AAU9IRL9_9CILI|nr:unnamed protein product [Blepharisma stoltei]
MSKESSSPTHFPKLTKPGYFTIPSISALSDFSSEQLSRVNGFTIANRHGKIVFEGFTDLRGLDLDKIVNIEKNDVTVYPDDFSKPVVGEGLNKPACITFYGTIAKKSLKVYNQALLKFLPASDSKLVESNKNTNSLTFKVPHFTRYGFFDDTDSDEEQPNPRDTKHPDYPKDKGEGLFSEEEEAQIYIPEFKEPPSRKAKEEAEEAEMVVEHPADEPKHICLNEHFRICFSPNGKFFLPTEKNELVPFSVAKPDHDVADSLELHLQYLEPPKIAKKVPGISGFSFKNKQNLWKRLAKLYIMKMNKEEWPGNAMLWSLVNVLYGDSTINTYEALNSQEYLENWTSTEHSPESVTLNRKRGLRYWIKAWNCLFEPLETEDAGEKILSQMARGEIKEAVITAIQSKNLFLANLLSQSTSGDFKRCVKRQLDAWLGNKTVDLFPESIYKIYRLMSGELDIAQLVDWKQSLQLVMTYGLPLNTDIQQAFEYFDKHIKEENAECYPYLPINKQKIDLCYYLIELYSRPKDAIENLTFALNPHTIQQNFNLEASWMTMVALYGVYYYSNFSDSFWSNRLNSNVDEIFKNLQKLSYAFAEELEFNGNWQWAVYVLMFITNSQKLIKQLISRHAFEIDLHEEFLIDDLHIPKAWIDEAKGLACEATFDYLNSIMHYLNCEDYYRAHNIFMENAAPQCIISFEGDALYEHLYERIILPLQEKSHELASWSFSGDLYCKYLHIAQRMEDFYRNEFKYSDLVELIIKIKELVSAMKELPISSIKQQAGISIMEKNLGDWHLELNQKLLVLDDHEENLPEKIYLRFIQRGDAIQQAEKFAGLYLKQMASKIR